MYYVNIIINTLYKMNVDVMQNSVVTGKPLCVKYVGNPV